MNNDKSMINLRKATIDDLELLKYWDSKQHIIDCDPDDDWKWEIELRREPIWRQQLVAEFKDTPIGFIQIIDPYLEETQYWGEIQPNCKAIDIWIGEEDNLGKGYGTLMMKLAIEQCFKDNAVNTIFIDPLATNVKAQRFYKRLGFTFVEERRFENSLCHVLKLSREDAKNSQLI
ncbi:MAG: GNAT family N-acetyltransferase [Candidatus Kapaibacteriales bacterium]